LRKDLVLQFREQALRNELADGRRDDARLSARQVLKGEMQRAGLAV
jgi:hypothetical protein